MYRVMPPAKGMETMGFFNYRVHENLGLDVEGRRSLRGLLGMTPEPVENAMTVAIANIPAEPTEDFFGQIMNHAGKTFIRFVYMMSYPKGVSREEGEDWFLNHLHRKHANCRDCFVSSHTKHMTNSILRFRCRKVMALRNS